MKDKCEKGYKGMCCCNCKNQIELFKHPWNKVNRGKVSDSTEMYACIAQFDCDNVRKGVLFESKHGMCEMYIDAHDNI